MHVHVCVWDVCQREGTEGERESPCFSLVRYWAQAVFQTCCNSFLLHIPGNKWCCGPEAYHRDLVPPITTAVHSHVISSLSFQNTLNVAWIHIHLEHT